MQFGKIKMFLLLNGLISLFLFFYFAPWLFSKVIVARIVTPYEANTIHVSYVVNGKNYFDDHLRNGIEFSQRFVSLRYLTFHPQTSCINSFMGMWAEPLAWWSVFLVASAMLLLTHNAVFSKGTIFKLHKKFPWISMEEYFPFNNGWFYQWNHTTQKEEHSSDSSKKEQRPLLKNGNR
ncbi:MAG: hypothetical protein ACTHMD_11930 [Flavisolibacter sp.]